VIFLWTDRWKLNGKIPHATQRPERRVPVVCHGRCTPPHDRRESYKSQSARRCKLTVTITRQPKKHQLTSQNESRAIQPSPLNFGLADPSQLIEHFIRGEPTTTVTGALGKKSSTTFIGSAALEHPYSFQSSNINAGKGIKTEPVNNLSAKLLKILA